MSFVTILLSLFMNLNSIYYSYVILQKKVLDALMNGCNRVQNHVDEVQFFSTLLFLIFLLLKLCIVCSSASS